MGELTVFVYVGLLTRVLFLNGSRGPLANVPYLEMKPRCYGNVAVLASVAQDVRDQISMVICGRNVLAHGSLKIGRAANRARLHRSRANFRFCHPRIVPQGAWVVCSILLSPRWWTKKDLKPIAQTFA